MNFAETLKRLDAVVTGRQPGEQAETCRVRRQDLRELLHHFRRLDTEVRQIQAPPQLLTGIELAARFVEKRRDDYVQEHGSTDPETGTVEFPGYGDEYVGELDEIIEGIRALASKEEPK